MKNKSFLHQANLFIRSLLFSIFLFVTVILWSFVCISIFWAPLRVRFAVITTWTTLMIQALKFFCNVDYKVEGLENIPKDRNGIIMCKHQSTWETFFLPEIFFEPAIIIKRELLWVPFFGWGAATVHPIAINRREKTSAMQQIITQGQQCLDQGRWVLIFPEGTRIPYGKVGKYRAGGARLAVETGYPILPIAHNAGRFWPKRRFIKQPGTVRMVIGSLIEPKGRTPEELTKEVQAWIEGTVQKIDRETIGDKPLQISN